MKDYAINWEPSQNDFKGYLRPLEMISHKDTRDKIESAYRAYMDDERYPQWLVLMYMFDDVINRKRRFSKGGNWFTKKVLHTDVENFMFLSQILQDFHISPSVYLSELFWLVDHKLYPSTYNRQMGVAIPDVTRFNTLFEIISTFKSNFVKDDLLQYPEIAGWRELYYGRSIKVDSAYIDNKLETLKFRRYTDKDEIIYSLVYSYHIANIMKHDNNANRFLLYLIYNAPCCSIYGDTRALFGLNDEGDEVKLIGHAIGLGVDEENLPHDLKSFVGLDFLEYNQKLWRIEDFARND